jgi:hypothetical protein
MTQRSAIHHTVVSRLLVTTAFVIFGWFCLYSALRAHKAEGPIGFPTGPTLAGSSSNLNTGAGQDATSVAPDHEAYYARADPSAQPHPASRSAENQPSRRQSLTMLSALLMEIQAAGTGGK